MRDAWAILEPPDKDQVAGHADGLIQRANLVRRDGWDQYRHVWSCGEVIGTARVPGDAAELQRCGETTISALARWAFDLWGVTDSQADTDAGLPRTQAWFDSLPSDIPPTTR
jgi:hypothetical protein